MEETEGRGNEAERKGARRGRAGRDGADEDGAEVDGTEEDGAEGSRITRNAEERRRGGAKRRHKATWGNTEGEVYGAAEF